MCAEKINASAGLPFAHVRDVLARDIKELRRIRPEISNKKLQVLIVLNKIMYLN
ncbi:hypothetical protein GCM10007905_22300 [Mixta theicola]|nr:hypothetical protein GCM10007905_22300 [Mixta theicola]